MKKNIFLIHCFSTLVLLAACQQQKKEASISDNQISLFDGQSLNGWRTFRNLPNNSWEVVDGTLHCKPFSDTEENFRSDLITETQYRNFEFTFEFKLATQSNSGVMFRVSEDYELSYATGPEYQLIDDEGYPGTLAEENKTGGNYAMHIPENKILKPVGEWNEGKILVQENNVEHWLNGTRVVAYELNSPDWIARRDASKWKDFPAYGTIEKGHIALQDHGNEVWFRNIAIIVHE
ncbi:MAG: DUF1080 domain-containing protein [Cyclobacteriaceae bacterium]|nr:DUF1080 domain-containing protein [Cyclobacteriaceae bacterium]